MKITLITTTFVALLLSILIGQDYFDLVEISAVPSKTETKECTHYLNLYKKHEFKYLSGKKSTLLAENKPIVLVNFWASWCKPCIKEIPDLNKLVKKYGDDILVVGVNTDEDNQLKLIEKVKNKREIQFPIVADKNSKLVDAFLVESIPFSVIYLNGKVCKKTEGIQDFMSGEYSALFDSALKK